MQQSVGPARAEAWRVKNNLVVGMPPEEEEAMYETDAETPDKTADVALPSKGALGALSSEGEYKASQKRFTEQADANLNLLMEAQKALRERRLGPTNREKWFSIAAALGQPTRTGSFGESLGNLNKSLAEIAAERRKAEDTREELGLKYGLEISGQKLRMLQAAANEAGEIYRAELAANKPKPGTWSENMGQFVSPDNPVATRNKLRVGNYTLTKYTDGSLRLRNPDGSYSVYTDEGVKIKDIPAGGAQ